MGTRSLSARTYSLCVTASIIPTAASIALAARNGKIVCLYIIIFTIVKKNNWRFCAQKSHDAKARLQSLEERGRRVVFAT
jgi:hypothetical protein